METRNIVLISGLAVILPLAVIASVHVRRARKIYSEGELKQDPPPILKLLVALVLGIAWVLSLVLPLSSGWQPILGNLALEYCLLVTYSANRHILTGTSHQLRRSWVTLVTTVLAGGGMLLGYFSRNNLAYPLLDRPFTSTLLYCLYYSLGCGTILFLFILILNLYWQSIRQSNDLSYQVR